jgi:predicted Zn finger-like uncharacterized protein
MNFLGFREGILPMAIQSACPTCGVSFSLADHLLGKKVRCKQCKHIFLVEAASETTGAEEPKVETGNDPTDLADKIQSEPRRSKNAFVPEEVEEVEPERPRQRYRDEEDEEQAHRPRRQPASHRSLLVPLMAAAVGLLVLASGIVFAIMLWSGDNQETGDDLNVDLSGPWPVAAHPGDMGFPADLTVTLHIARAGDENTCEAISDRLRELVDSRPGGSISYAAAHDRMTVVLAPVKDPEAFAAKIDFGTVRGVEGRMITLIARKVARRPANAESVTKALHDLKSSNTVRRLEAAIRLKRMLPDEARRKEVAQVLESLVNEPEGFARGYIIEALGVWGTKESTPHLLKALSHRHTRREVCKALGQLKDARASEPVAERLEDPFGRHEAAEALKAIGPAAEKAVIKRLHHRDMWVREAAIEIIQVIGTRESIPALEKVVAENDVFLTRPAKEAIQTIKARTGK